MDLEGEFVRASGLLENFVVQVELVGEFAVRLYVDLRSGAVILLETFFLAPKVPTGVEPQTPKDARDDLDAVTFIDGFAERIQRVHQEFVLVVDGVVAGSESVVPLQGFGYIHLLLFCKVVWVNLTSW